MSTITVLTTEPASIEGSWSGDRAMTSEEGLTAATGWSLKPEGLCRDDLCVPVADRSRLVTTDGIDLGEAARLLGRPTVSEPDAGLLAIGLPVDDRQQALQDKKAPDFTLNDLAGHPQTFWGWRGKKILLVAFASW